MIRRILTVLLLAAVLFGFAACAKKPATKLVIATDATFPPMESIDDNKNIVGYDIDLMKAVAKAGGFEVTFQNTAWGGIFAGLENGEYSAIISSVTITDERKLKYDFSESYFNAGQFIVVPTATEGVTTLADLKGKKVGAQIGTTGAFEIEKVMKDYSIEEKAYNEIGLAFADLAIGRIDAVVVDTWTAATYVKQTAEFKDKFKIVGDALTNEYYGVVVKKGDTKTLDLINKGLKKVLTTSEEAAIKAQWLK